MSDIGRDPIVVTSADEAYAMPLAVMVRSLVANLDPARTLRLYVIDGGLTARSRARITASWPRERLAIEWLVPDLARLGKLKVSGHVHVATYPTCEGGRQKNG